MSMGTKGSNDVPQNCDDKCTADIQVLSCVSLPSALEED